MESQLELFPLPRKKKKAKSAFKKTEADHVLEAFERAVSSRLGHPFHFERFSSEWKKERAIAKKFIERFGNWHIAIRALEIMFNDPRLKWKERTSLAACFRDVSFAKSIIGKEAKEAEKRWQRTETETTEDVFTTDG